MRFVVIVVEFLINSRVIKNLGAFGAENNNFLLTRFLLHDLQTMSSRISSRYLRGKFNGLEETAIHGVVLMGNTAFSSCSTLFGVLIKESKIRLEKLIRSLIDQAKLDDLLVSCTGGGDTYGVSFRSISPDQNFFRRIGVAQSLSDSARESLDGVYRAIDIYLRQDVSF
ncbi:hypothetical protein V2J09_015322 [Rumex salicifolius]